MERPRAEEPAAERRTDGQYGVDLTKSFPRTHVAKLQGDAKTAVETDYAKLLADVRRRIKDVEERTIEM
ncbi:MAG TPA: hypothetical protein VN699_03010 [Pirellulales bacterium]|nr:hypothetical protein [Pirellulales bacterium]